MSRSFRLKPPLPARESDVVKACCDLVRLGGWYPIRLQSGLFKTPDHRWVRIGEPGLPDFVVIHPEYPAFFMEIKRRGGKLRDEQVQKIAVLRDVLRLAVAVVDSTISLLDWLAEHERIHTDRSKNA
jgi:hypothetical protein